MNGSLKLFRVRRNESWAQVNPRKHYSLVLLMIVAALLTACHGNPNVRKQKYLESGKRYSAEGKYREAAIQYLNALKVDNDFSAANYELAQTYRQMGQSSEACVEFARVVALRPKDYEARIELGNLLLASGKATEAQVQADAVVGAQPKNPGAHALLSAIAFRRGQKDQALTEIHRALELEPHRALFHENLALLQANDPSKATLVEDELLMAITLEPKSLNARGLLAAFYARSNRLPEAEKASWDAVAADPASLAARENVAQIILRRGRSCQG